jgi:hypothetical protein
MTGNHPRNIGPMQSSPRCGAQTRSGKRCQSPAVLGKKRCRMHGGAPGSGAPRGNKNALKDGLYTREAIEERWNLHALLRQSRLLIQRIKRYDHTAGDFELSLNLGDGRDQAAAA